MRRPCPWILLLTVTALALTGTLPAQAQDSTSRSALGLRAVGGASLLVGYSRVERGVNAAEVALNVDLGHFASRKVRLAAELNYLRSSRFSEYVEAEDSTYRDAFYDLSPKVWLQLLARDPARRFVPFVRFGVGVHALTSSFGSVPLDIRYNSNVFGLSSGAGARWRLGPRALVIEGTAVLAREVSRGGVRLGVEWVRPTP